MSARDILRYLVAAAVGIAMWLSDASPWTTLGIVVLAVAVVAFGWHASLARRPD